MTSVELIEDSGLIVIREGLDPVLVEDFSQEWQEKLTPELLAEAKARGLNVVPGIDVVQVGYSVDELLKDPSSATSRVINLITVREPNEYIFINHQPPYGRQNFHQDHEDTVSDVTIVHASTGGAFDYAPNATSEEEAQENHRTLELSAGDIVIQTRTKQWHRGRNGSNQPRITAAIATVHTKD